MVRLERFVRKRLGELLISAGLVTEDQVRQTLEEQKVTGELFGDILLAKGLVNESAIATAIVTQYRLPFLHLTSVEISDKVKGVFPEGIMRRHQFAPFDKIGGITLIACAGTIDPELIEKLEEISGGSVRLYITTFSDVKRVIDDHFKEKAELSEMGELLGLGGE